MWLFLLYVGMATILVAKGCHNVIKFLKVCLFDVSKKSIEFTF